MAPLKPSVIFMGTPYFAVPSLEIIIKNDYPVKAVVTAADKPSGRGLTMARSAVKQAALSHGIPVLQPRNLKDDSFEDELRRLSADMFVVVAFRMLPEKIWSIPPLGTINLHASLLPLYRGAAPINHAIINGEKYTGVTTFLIEKEIDTGKVFLQEKIMIDDNDTAGSLHDRLMDAGAELLLKTVAAISEGGIVPVKQDAGALSRPIPPAPKITKSDCRINWSDPSGRIRNFIRGLNPYPGAWTTMNSGGRTLNLKLYEIEKISGPSLGLPGKVTVSNNNLFIQAGDGPVLVKKVQAEGRKAMDGSEFTRGFRPEPDAICY
jgi:methionyl-tRNA formyltransferase